MNKKSVVLLSVVIILLTIALIGATLVAFLSLVNLDTRRVGDEAKALYLAEAGLAQAIYLLRNHADAGGYLDEAIGPINLGDGTYLIKIDLTQAVIASTGNVNGAKKTIQLQYNTL